MRRIYRPALLVASIACLAAAPQAFSFTCGHSTCHCTGEQDCTDLRHSSQCQGSVTCQNSGDNLICGCVAAEVQPGNGNTGGNSNPIKTAPVDAPPVRSARPP